MSYGLFSKNLNSVLTERHIVFIEGGYIRQCPKLKYLQNEYPALEYYSCFLTSS